ncbi:MAG: hypothetical protein PHG87_04635 [Candidatus Omnitrophica bacterium]|nr:hypothetical protein [Candidatus Omnitrophota bacterium]
MMKKLFLSAIIIVCLFLGQLFASGAAGIVEKGNRLYKDQKYKDALKLYDQALSGQPDSTVINFDAGAAWYKINNYQKANSSFEKALITENKNLEAKANYNLGNSRYMLGLSKENTDLSGAVQLLEGALTNYKRTLELIPKDEDAKINYTIAEKKLKELRERLKQQPQENKNSQKQQEQNKEQARQQQGEGKQMEEEKQVKQEEKKAADKKEQFHQEQASQAQRQPQKQKQEEQKKQEQQAAAQPEESKEMSKEEANMLLEGYRQEENTSGMLKDDRKGVEEKVLKDW